jgi:1,6-anhydro-N-acetylmuramate kinase
MGSSPFELKRALDRPRRWILGLRVGPGCRHVVIALVGAESTGLALRASIFAWRRRTVPREARRLFRGLCHRRAPPADVATLAAQLAEQQAILVEQLVGQIAPIGDRVCAVAVDDPGLWRRRAGLLARCGLCDTARLAELTGLNVIDDFAARDLAQDGAGSPLNPIPDWLLLHDAQKNRALLRWGHPLQITILPAARDASGAARVLYDSCPIDPASNTPAARASAVARRLTELLPRIHSLDEVIVAVGQRRKAEALAALAAQLPEVRLLDAAQFAAPPAALAAATVALLGLLHLDQTPANLPSITAARAPRVLGRLTPGSLPNWHRLLRDLSLARPSVVTLRSAV